MKITIKYFEKLTTFETNFNERFRLSEFAFKYFMIMFYSLLVYCNCIELLDKSVLDFEVQHSSDRLPAAQSSVWLCLWLLALENRHFDSKLLPNL